MSQGNTPVGETTSNFTEPQQTIDATSDATDMKARIAQLQQSMKELMNMMKALQPGLGDEQRQSINIGVQTKQDTAQLTKKIEVLQQDQNVIGAQTSSVDAYTDAINEKLAEVQNKEVINNAKITTIPPRELENNKHRPKEILNTVPLSSPSTSIKNNEHQPKEVVSNFTSLPPPHIKKDNNHTLEVINLALAQEKAKMVKKVDVVQQQQEKDGSTTIDNNKLPLRTIKNNEQHNEEVANLLSLDTPTKTLIKHEKINIKQTNGIQVIIPPPHVSVQCQSEPTSTLTLIKDEKNTIKQTNGIQVIIPPPHVSVQF
ncbi:unnamed protein product [Ambrosiozyma monospora]|uniref:Unnamed protein product n=1 Tax=Ambrosiozyma monospora TaxID=43982 RepID=A0A9W6Z4F6_AMBMO|nr:unnamed protein product [Ambrosiozyma monospora]